MFNDIYESIHNDDLGPVVGYFRGNPVRSWDPLASAVRRENSIINIIKTSSGHSVPAEVLPGETVCEDHLVRRETAEERMGDPNQGHVEQVQGDVITIEQARQTDGCIIWRPMVSAGQYADHAVLVG